jgi:hypothetical protein
MHIVYPEGNAPRPPRAVEHEGRKRWGYWGSYVTKLEMRCGGTGLAVQPSQQAPPEAEDPQGHHLTASAKRTTAAFANVISCWAELDFCFSYR